MTCMKNTTRVSHAHQILYRTFKAYVKIGEDEFDVPPCEGYKSTSARLGFIAAKYIPALVKPDSSATKALKREILRVYLSSISWTLDSLFLSHPPPLSPLSTPPNAAADPINLLSSAILRRPIRKKKRELHAPDGRRVPLED